MNDGKSQGWRVSFDARGLHVHMEGSHGSPRRYWKRRCGGCCKPASLGLGVRNWRLAVQCRKGRPPYVGFGRSSKELGRNTQRESPFICFQCRSVIKLRACCSLSCVDSRSTVPEPTAPSIAPFKGQARSSQLAAKRAWQDPHRLNTVTQRSTAIQGREERARAPSPGQSGILAAPLPGLVVLSRPRAKRGLAPGDLAK